MKVVRWDLSEAEMARLIEGRVYRAVAKFFEENHRMPDKNEMAFYCPKCWWWTDDQKHLHAVEQKLRTTGNDCVIKKGEVEYTVKIFCPECQFFLRAAPVQRFLRMIKEMELPARKEGTLIAVATNIPSDMRPPN
jgi:predicted RNA-binding Zn-ribbon protein involved in translation (DUF1610 family)